MLAINVFISQGPKLGWFSGASLGLLVAFVVFVVAFFRIETSRSGPFVDLSIFGNKTFAGATLSNFLLNGSAGTLVVALGLVQRAAGWSSLESGLLTLGYLVTIVGTIRVGEKLLQKYGPKKPMMWGTTITAVGIVAHLADLSIHRAIRGVGRHRLQPLRHRARLLCHAVHRRRDVERAERPGGSGGRTVQDGVLARLGLRRGDLRGDLHRRRADSA